MTIDFNVMFCVKVLVLSIMLFSCGLKIDATKETRDLANIVWIVTLVLLWVLNIAFPTR